MNYPLPFLLKISSFSLQSIILFCGYYWGIEVCFTLSYLLTIIYSVAFFVVPLWFPTTPDRNTFVVPRQTHHSILSLSLVAGIALLIFTGLGLHFFEQTYQVQTITVFFAIILMTNAFEKPNESYLRWKKDGLLIVGTTFSNTLPHESILTIEVDGDSITLQTKDGITHHIENIDWDTEKMESARAFLEKKMG
ncbi:hypothetical protein [Flavobacterium sp.]|jgi:hypothetical protein|uniref:hypothetical protein n=1 Tax=Flavobacterium sp. TaxID=239 RepID=UPI0022C4CA13|nr:hypothetical protein [Flavobacterium sp.]MCZ8144008.1 hypothetical protein [Flavobacterium sp.]MCZ8366493.1 hypothetical protein [Flavobacterium sp.]